MAVLVEAEGLAEYQKFFEAIPDRANLAASRALNDVAGGSGLAVLRQDIQQEVNFPAGYVNSERLYFSQRATPTSLEARITGRQRATSLARFSLPGSVVGAHKGIEVQVRRGQTKFMKRAFLVNLRAGTTDGGNVGLAIRLKPGERLTGSTAAVKLTRGDRPNDNVYLLYGPSVNQVLREVAKRDTPTILRNVGIEFVRQWELLSK